MDPRVDATSTAGTASRAPARSSSSDRALLLAEARRVVAQADAPAPTTEPARAAPSDPPAKTGAKPTSHSGSQPQSQPQSQPGSQPESARKAGAPGSKQVISLDEFLVEGKLEKPSAYYILHRSSADHDWARLDARFLPLVLESVQDPLF